MEILSEWKIGDKIGVARINKLKEKQELKRILQVSRME